MRLFLDTSVLLAASGSAAGASREVFSRSAAADWSLIRPSLHLRDDVLTLDRPAVFGPAKDRPILFSALAWADALLTLDRVDFGQLMNQSFYGLPVLTPGTFLQRERTVGRLR